MNADAQTRTGPQDPFGVFMVFAIAFVLTWSTMTMLLLRKSYSQTADFNAWLSFRLDDYPGNLQEDCRPEALGVHYFGDFWSIVCHSRLPSPYLAGVGSNYFPFTYWVARIWDYGASLTSPLIAIFSGYITMCLALLITCLTLLKEHTRQALVPYLLLSTLVASAGAIMTLDRGNIQWLVTASLAFAVLTLIKGHLTVSVLLIALASAMKGYPAVFLIPLWFQFTHTVERVKTLLLFAAVSVSTFFVPLLLFDGSLYSNLNGLRRWLGAFENAERATLFYNNSWVGSTRSVATLVNSSALHRLADVQASLISIIILVVGFTCFSARYQLSRNCNIVFSIVTITALMPLVNGYVLAISFLYVPLLLDIESSQLRASAAIAVGILLVPKGIPIGDTGASLTSLLNGPLSLLILSAFVVDSLTAERTTSAKLVRLVGPTHQRRQCGDLD